MQFKVVCALLFATLAAAATVPVDPGGSDPEPSKTPPANPSNQVGTTKVEPPFLPTSGDIPPIIKASKCSAGHLRCCKFSFSLIVILALQLKRTTTIKGKITGLPTDSSVVAQLPLGISKDDFFGYAGIKCFAFALDSASEPATWFVSTRSEFMNDLKFNFFSF
jgi:hypothetical protein